MSRIVSITSFRGGTGKSNAAANISVLLASQGKRVGIIDTDIQSPGIHILFGLEAKKIVFSLNDYLWGKCRIEETAHDMTSNLNAEIEGKIYLIPSSLQAGEITHLLREGYDIGLLNNGFQAVIDTLKLDVLMIDTHPGLNEETLLAIVTSDVLVIILRPDQQDYQGTAITVEVARKLDVPRMMLLMNKVPRSFDYDFLKDQAELVYRCPVALILPHSNKMMTLASNGIFVLQHPDHPMVKNLKELAGRILE